MILNIHAGHNPDGGVGCGAIGLVKESTQNRVVKDKVISLLKERGHTVYDCTVNNGTSASDVLKKIVTKCNAHKVDLDVSIHFNAGSKDKDRKTTGTEVYVYSSSSKAVQYAKRTVSAIAELGFTNRGVIERPELYVLKHTVSPAMLVECCFVDDKDDIALYDADKMAAAIVKGITGAPSTPAPDTTNGKTQSASLKGLSASQFIEAVGPMYTHDQQKSGVLASISLAQACLESGYATTDLAQNANNLHGMKRELSGNSWANSAWDGKSTYSKKTQEYYNGKTTTVTAAFRKYSCIEDSISDHSAYLLGAKNGSKLRYDGLKGCKDYKKAAQIIFNGGYATDPQYVQKLCSLVTRYNLEKYNYVAEAAPIEPWYKVRKGWNTPDSQVGAYHNLNLAKACADNNPGFTVYDEKGNALYTSKLVWFRVKKSWTDVTSQKGAFTMLENAKECADDYPGCFVFDESGTVVYPLHIASVTNGSVHIDGKHLYVFNQHKLSGTYAHDLDKNGCGASCTVFALALRGKSVTPQDILKKGISLWGAWPRACLISGQGIATIIKKYGVPATYHSVTKNNKDSIKSVIDKALKSGKQVICWTDDNGLSGDPFAAGEHYVMACGYNKDGKVVVANSGNKGPVNLVSLATLCKFLQEGSGEDKQWWKSVAKSAGIIVVG